MKHILRKDITCTNSGDCSDMVVDKLEKLGLILMSRKKGSIVNGSVTIHHEQNNHMIRVEIYESNEKPNSKHFGDFKKPSKMPAKKELEDKI